MSAGEAGSLLLGLGFASSTWALFASAAGSKLRDSRWTESGRRAIYAAGLSVALSTLLLIYLLDTRDFSIAYVANYISLSTPRPYALAALWAGMEGSLLFWTLTTSIYALSAVWITRRRGDFQPLAAATSVLAGLISFFTGVLLFAANPFAPSTQVVADGAGLNPLLQSPFMVIHPVMLYLGLTGFAVPFAFAVAAMVRGRLDHSWFTVTRRWTVLAWSFLSIGIVLGAAWAYMELGWGGYWAWDPVENASLIPWLTATAFLHSVLIQERRGMLKIWNAGLILTTYCLAIFGTFLTRSGLLSSVHTFSESPVGKAFLPLLALLLLGSFALLGWRFDKLRSQRSLDSLLSREAMFLFNNLLFAAIAFTVLWGTIYPVLVEAISGEQVAVGPPFFNSIVIPLGLALLGLTGIGPLVAWRSMRPSAFARELRLPLGAGAAGIIGLVLLGLRSPAALVAVALCIFVAVTTFRELFNAGRAHRREGGFLAGVAYAMSRNRRRYGGYVVHLGIVLIFFGLAGAAFSKSWAGDVSKGERFEIGAYGIRYADLTSYRSDERIVNSVRLELTKNGDPAGEMAVQRNFHLSQRQPQSEIGLRTTYSEDLYVVLTATQEDGTVTLRAFINPLVVWIWIGAGVMAAGMLILLSARGRPRTLPVERTVTKREQPADLASV